MRSASDSRHPEMWLPIAGYEGRYEISSIGRVKSLPRVELTARGHRRPVRGGIVKAHPNTDGYPHVPLRKDGKLRLIKVHRLVAEMFVPGRNRLHREVAHLDNNRGNPRADNLKWVSKAENRSHRKIHGTECQGSNHHFATINEAQAREIKIRLSVGERAAMIAADMLVSPHVVRDIKRGKNWRHVHI